MIVIAVFLQSHTVLKEAVFEMGFMVAAFSLLLAVASVRRSSKAKPQAAEILGKISSMLNQPPEFDAVLAAALDESVNFLGMNAALCRFSLATQASPKTVCCGLDRNVFELLEKNQECNLPPHRLKANPEDSPQMRLTPDIEALQEKGLSFHGPFPIRSGSRTLGFLGFAGKDSGKLKAAQMGYLHTLTEILGIALVNAELREQSAKFAEDLIALQEVNKIISQGFNLEDIIHRIVVEGRRLAKTNQCHLFKLDDKHQFLIGSATTQAENIDIRTVRIPFSGASAPVRALLEKKVIAVENIRSDEPEGGAPMESLGWHAAIFAPLLTKERAIGVLVCSDGERERTFTDDEILRAEVLAHQAAIAIENAELFQVVSRSHREWETTFDAMQDCVSLHDTTGKVIRANVALARRLKTIPQKVIGRYCSDIYDSEGSVSRICSHTSSLKSETIIVEELTLPLMDGVFQVSISPWYDKNNNLVGSIHVGKDISNERQLQQQLIQSEKLSAIGELISGIAHELNNPLTGVMGYSQLLQLRKDLDDGAKDKLLKINNLALRCQKIVQNLLSFARKQKPERTLSDINEILEKTVELRSYELQVNNIEMVRELDRHLPKTIADAHQLQQVFLNVLTNAEQAMLESHGKGRLAIRTRSDTDKTRIVVEVIDDGPGIPENHLTRIFDPFFTTKEVGKGTGLGLSLSYGMIKEHGGNIYARSRPGEGATFVIELPVIKHHESGAAKDLEPPAIQFEKLVRNKRILVVDDEKYILDFFVEAFQTLPLQIDTANDGQSAMRKMEHSDYDLIITDFKMPHMSGKDLFHWIEENRPQCANRIIFVTGDTVSAETRSFFEENKHRFLEKPFKIEEVKEVIQQAFEDKLSQ